MFKNLFFIFTLLFLDGCASISKDGQAIYVNVVDSKSGNVLNDVQCIVKGFLLSEKVFNDDSFKIHYSKTKNDDVIICSKPGYQTITVKPRKEFASNFLYNIAFPPGAILDIAEGTYKNYQSRLTIKMQKLKSY
jgi:hypothetical protein